MKLKIVSAVSLFLLVLNSVAFAGSGSKPKRTKARQTNRLVAQLPYSDAIVVIDIRRFLDDALPKVLASKPGILNKITAELDKVQTRLGVDLR
jgi:hypothetical protein